MPLGSSSAAPVIRPGPSLPKRGARCSRERRLGGFWDLVRFMGSDSWEGRFLRYAGRPPEVTHLSGSNPSCPAYNAAGGQTEDSMTRYLLTGAVLTGAILCTD